MPMLGVTVVADEIIIGYPEELPDLNDVSGADAGRGRMCFRRG